MAKRVRDDPERWARLFAESQAGTYQYKQRTPYRALYARKLGDGSNLRAQSQTRNFHDIEIQTGRAYRIAEHSEGEACFLVRRIYQLSVTGSCLAAGFVLLSAKDLNGVVIGDENEVVWVTDVVGDVSEVEGSQGLTGVRYDLIPVDYLLEECNIRFLATGKDDKRWEEEKDGAAIGSSTADASRTCRFVYFRVFASPQQYLDTMSLPKAETVRPLNVQELAALGKGLSPGTALPRQPPTSDDRQDFEQYTFADMFHGAGGATEAAKMAGLRPVLAMEKDSVRHATYLLNNPELEDNGALLLDVSHFDREEQIREAVSLNISIIHASPPCRPFSMAKTWPCAYDSDDARLLFEIPHVVSLLRPRMLTVENVPGLVWKARHRRLFHLLLGELLDLGYAASWGVFRLHEYGNASVRRRLVLVAAAPGERLPRFPAPTHGADGRSGLEPFVTARDALANIPSTCAHHDVGDRAVGAKRRRGPWDHDRVLAGTLTSVPGPWHPSGLRELTVREYLRLNSFPDKYEMVGTYKSCRKQVGDAVPPGPFAVFLREVVRTLRDTDEGREQVRASKFERPLVWLKK